ncbi:MAG: hypothetical protein MR319_00210 [Mediterranea sp.]|nr:hypothetical protein [Mediterranea sp.]
MADHTYLCYRDCKPKEQRYAADAKVQSTKEDAQLKLLTIVFKGWELVKAVEVELRMD